jgi:hypothetical protein
MTISFLATVDLSPALGSGSSRRTSCWPGDRQAVVLTPGTSLTRSFTSCRAAEEPDGSLSSSSYFRRHDTFWPRDLRASRVEQHLFA